MNDKSHEPSTEKGRLYRRVEIIRKELDQLPEWEKKLIGYKRQQVKSDV